MASFMVEIAMVSGWESEGPGFKPWRLQETFNPGLTKNNKWFPAKDSVPLMNKKLQDTL